MSDRFNKLPGMSCVPADGAMYLLPKIDMPKKALEEAEKRGKKADVMYTLDMLGMCSRHYQRSLHHRGNHNTLTGCSFLLRPTRNHPYTFIHV